MAAPTQEAATVVNKPNVAHVGGDETRAMRDVGKEILLLDNVPTELKAYNQWVAWRSEERDGKPTKVPHCADPKRLRRADTTERTTWCDFDDTVFATESGIYDGAGFVFTQDDPFCGVDIDKCIDPETGEIDERAREIVAQLDSYTELSPSGTGLHIILKGDLSGLEGRRKGAVEMYDRERFFTVTGEVYGEPKPINDRQDALKALHREVFAERPAAPKSAVPTGPSPAGNLEDEKLLHKMFSSKNGANIRALWDGDTSGHGGDASAADLALAAHLMWWTSNDTQRADTLFRQSGLMRPKWDELRGPQTYGARTLLRIVATDADYSAQIPYSPGPVVVAGQQSDPPAEKARRKIVLAADLHTQATDIINALHDLNSLPEIFQRGRELVRVVRTDGVSSIETLTLDSIRSFAQERLECVKLVPTNKKDAAGKPVFEEVPANLKRDVAAYIMTASRWPFAELRGIVHTPHFSAQGELVAEPGYSPKSKLYLDLDGFTPRPVNPVPTALEVEAAKRLILDQMLTDFPFVDEASRAHAVALGVLPYVRVMIDGPTPLHASDASTAGTGKSLLVEALTYAATGRSPKIMAEGRDDDEWRKRITSTLLESPSTVMIDNVNRRLDSGALSSVLTSRVWSDRLLGQSRNVTVPNLACWTATGNNLVTSNEVARRLVWIRIDAKVEQPWKRTEFLISDLMAWVSATRHEIVWAFCVLVQNWLAQGRPIGCARLGSYEAWGEVVGGILSAANIPGFLGNLDALYERADAESAEWREFVGLWHSTYERREVTAAALYDLASKHGALLSVLGEKGEQSQKIRLGRALTKREDRVVGQFTIRKGSGAAKQKVATYYLDAQAEPGGESGGELGQKAGSGGELKNELPAKETVPGTQIADTAGSGGECSDIFSVKAQEVPLHIDAGENPDELPATPRQTKKESSTTQENGRGVEKHTPRHSPPLPANSPPFWPTVAEHPYTPDTCKPDDPLDRPKPQRDDRLEHLRAAIYYVGNRGRRFDNPLAARREALAFYVRVCANKTCAELCLKPDDADPDEIRVEAMMLYGAACELQATGKTDLFAWAEAAEKVVAQRKEAN